LCRALVVQRGADAPEFAGVLIGQFTPGFVADISLANELAEIGVILLVFGVGLHFSLRDLLSVRKIALPERLYRS